MTPCESLTGSRPGPSPQAIESLVGRLRDLREGPLAFQDIVHLGDAAVPATEEVLRGPPQVVYHPRALAADALAAIGTPEAVRALTRALRDSIARELPPPLLEAESLLVNHIADHLAHSRDPEVIDTLLAALQRRCYPYCAEALGLSGDPRAIPLLIACLYDDPARPRACRALLRFGEAAAGPLAQVLLKPRTRSGWEPPGEIDARMTAARSLGDLCAQGRALPWVINTLRQALGDRQQPVRVEAALALARLPGEEADDAVGVLAVALDEVSWARAQEILLALVRIGAPAEALAVALIGLRPRDEAERRRRMRAVELVGMLRTAAAVPLLRSLAQAPEVALRAKAIAALDRIPAAEISSFAAFLSDPEPAVRRRAVQALKERGALGPEGATGLLGDADDGVRRLAMAAVRGNLAGALPALKRAVWHLGAPLAGWAPRWRLWRQAVALLLCHALTRRASSEGPARRPVRTQRSTCKKG